MVHRCAGFKRSGEQCTANVNSGQHFCWWHDPANKGKRQRIASKGGKGKVSKVAKDLHQLLEDLTAQVVSGALDPYPGSVAGQLIGVRLRLLEYERRVKESDVLEQRIEELESLLADNKEGKQWAG